MPSVRLLAVLPLLLLGACRGGWRNIRDSIPNRGVPATSFPQRNEEDARRFGEIYLAGQAGTGSGSGFDAVFPDDLDEICLNEIHWDTLYRFDRYQPSEWQDQTAFLDVSFPEGPRLRIVFGSPRWTAFPVRGDSTDLPLDCKNCPDSASIRKRSGSCRE